MVGNIGTAQVWLPYAYYQAKRLELDMDKLKQTTGYRNLILDDDSRVYLFAKDGIMNITVEGAGFNPYDQTRVSPEDWDVSGKPEEEEQEYITCVVYNGRAFWLNGTYNKNSEPVNGSLIKIKHICPRAQIGVFKKYDNYRLSHIANNIPLFGARADIDYDKLMRWNVSLSLSPSGGVSIPSSSYSGCGHAFPAGAFYILHFGTTTSSVSYTYQPNSEAYVYTNNAGSHSELLASGTWLPAKPVPTFSSAQSDYAAYRIDAVAPDGAIIGETWNNGTASYINSSPSVWTHDMPIDGNGENLLMISDSTGSMSGSYWSHTSLPGASSSGGGGAWYSNSTFELKYGNMTLASGANSSLAITTVGGSGVSYTFSYNYPVYIDSVIISNKVFVLWYQLQLAGSSPSYDLYLTTVINGVQRRTRLYQGSELPGGAFCYNDDYIGFVCYWGNLVTGGGFKISTGRLTTTPVYSKNPSHSLIPNLAQKEWY